MDVFTVFDMAPALAIDPAALEARYLDLSRACHPDHHGGGDASAQIALLTRAAEVNDAYRILRDRWLRAEALVEAQAPGVLARTKTLSSLFLGDALELAEDVATTDASSPAGEALRARLTQMVDEDFEAVSSAVTERDWDAAATQLHQARYHRKALRDLAP